MFCPKKLFKLDVIFFLQVTVQSVEKQDDESCIKTLIGKLNFLGYFGDFMMRGTAFL
jgi:hypothetical protein